MEIFCFKKGLGRFLRLPRQCLEPGQARPRGLGPQPFPSPPQRPGTTKGDAIDKKRKSSLIQSPITSLCPLQLGHGATFAGFGLFSKSSSNNKNYFFRSWFAFPSFRRKIFFFQVISIDNSCLLPKTPVPDQQQYLISTDRVMLMGQPVLSMIKETDG